jgi:hypothetical protein
MKKIFFVFVSLVFLSKSGVAQQPYFQQDVNYTINVKLDDVNNELTADEKIEYTNNSPNTLTFIYMHLWPNAYKDDNTEMAREFIRHNDTKFKYATEKERGFIDQLDFKIDGQPAKYELLKDSIDICKLYLNTPLKSGEKAVITTPFHVKIPSGEISRLGHVGQSYQITQWYPKPAVYDRNGWNYIPYLTQGEFYSEYGSFDVSITLPKNYVLGATGDMVDGEKELEWLNQKVKETEAIKEFDSKNLAFPASDTEMKTLRFKQTNVHDFAWFCDKRYHVLKGEVETPHTKHKVTTWIMFTNAEGNIWKKAVQYVNDAVYYYSLWNGDYPYNHCTAVDGTISAGGGMEYPNITVIGSSRNAFMLDLVIAHEVGHNWFYGLLGSNERVHPWMDEGINSFNELRYVRTKYPNQKLIGRLANTGIGKAFDLTQYPQKSQYELGYLFSASKNEDQPIELPAYAYSNMNYGCIVYYKTALVFDYLRATVGEKELDKAMQRYFDEWHYKHPQPEDLKKVLEQSTGKDLSWFFDNMINSTKKLDYKIKNSHKKADGTWDIVVKNKTAANVPLFIQAVKDNKVLERVVYDGFAGKKTLSFPAVDADHFKIDYDENIPELNRKNNSIRTKGLFKKTEPLRLQFLGSLDNPNKTQLFFTPVAGWNNYNRGMLGMAFYNHTIFPKKLQFELMPMYSFGTKDIAGYAHIMYSVFPAKTFFQNVFIGVTVTRYAYETAPFALNFNKIAPELNIEFKKSNPYSKFKSTLRYRNVLIFADSYTTALTGTDWTYTKTQAKRQFNDLTYDLDITDAVHPMNIRINYQEGGQRDPKSGATVDEMSKLSLTAKFNYKFKKKNKGFNARVFAGTFLGTNAANASAYRFRLSGQSGYQDYMYDNIFLGRTETSGILAQQFTQTDGAFKFYSTLGQTGQWLTSLNLKSSLGNLKLPIKLYADVATMGTDVLLKEKVLYNAGLCLSLSDNLFEIYFPLLLSKDLQDYKSANNLKYQETIRFTLNLNLLNPFEALKNFSF